MAILDIFSKRQKRIQKAGVQDVYQYDAIPETFRMQVLHIWKTALGRYFVPGEFIYRSRESPSNRFWVLIHDSLARELGLGVLAGDFNDDPKDRCSKFLLTADTSGTLDIIELSFRVIDRGARKLDDYDASNAAITQSADSAIEELNQRFREHGIGFQYAEGMLIRLDSQFVHSEVLKPALSLLNAVGFDGPADEFIRAFEHYRHGRTKEAVADALKAFESTMKSICAKRGWSYQSTATAKQLMEVIFDKGLIPPMLGSHFNNLRVAMESGLPTIRNKTSGHGQGPSPLELPAYFAAYSLHLTASNIIFLVEADKALK